MPKFRVTSPDGKTYSVNAPEGATQEDAIAYVKSQLTGQGQQPAQPSRPKAQDLGLEEQGTIRGEISGEGPKLAGRSLNAGRAQNFLQGVGFNFADEVLPYTNAALDEAYGAVTGQDAGDFSKNVDFYRDQAKEIGRRMWEERPTETLLSQIGGGVASGGLGLTRAATGAIGRVAPGTAAALRAGTAGLGARVVQGGVAGGIGGALAGAGSGEGLEGRVQGAAVGGILGAPLGAALPVAAAGLGSTGRFLRSSILPGTVNADRRAGEVLGQAVARSDLQSPSPTQALSGMQGGGINNAALADLSDELTALTGAVSRSPGKGRQIVGDFLRARQEGDPTLGQAGGGQWADILDDIAAKVSPSVSTKRAAESIVAKRAEDAKPLYEKVFQVGNIASGELDDLAKIPAMRSALARGVNLAKQEGALPSDFKVGSGPLPAKVWHFAKMAIDDLIGGATRSGEKTAARSLRIMQERLLNELDNVTGGDYGVARTNFAGHSALLNALESGKGILQRSVTAEDIADQLAALTNKGEQEFFRAGAAQALRDTVSRVGRTGNAAAKFLNRGDMQQKLQALFGNQQDYADFMARMLGRSRLHRTYAELQGSPTAARIEAGDDLAAGVTGGAEPENLIKAAATGGRQGFARAALQRLQDGSVRYLSEKVRTRLAEMLTSTDPQKVREAAQMIEMAARMAKAAQVRSTQIRSGALQGGVIQPAAAMTER